MMITDPMLGKYYIIDKDHSICVCHKEKKGGEKVDGYYSNVEGAVRGAARMIMSQSPKHYQSLKEYLDEYQEVMNKFKSLWVC